ncbi:uncharacterized protein ARMOST_17033 [Armillaria ostoyae]|uniref:Uncharacterized protein n=1 Tax=Armillaria ostoyae TaxID=47428 RepID=A0A284RXV7_ARMOS|nr:uncharacterized protein ARMOST_17033 [Armillaria ostoyae]
MFTETSQGLLAFDRDYDLEKDFAAGAFSYLEKVDIAGFTLQGSYPKS